MTGVQTCALPISAVAAEPVVQAVAEPVVAEPEPVPSPPVVKAPEFTLAGAAPDDHPFAARSAKPAEVWDVPDSDAVPAFGRKPGASEPVATAPAADPEPSPGAWLTKPPEDASLSVEPVSVEPNAMEPSQDEPAQAEAPATVPDYEAHYTLGIAYKNMGLYEDAMDEFHLSKSADSFYLDSCLMTALCLKDQRAYEPAIRSLEMVLSDPRCQGAKGQAIRYELGMLYEAESQ